MKGTYFLLADYSAISSLDDVSYCQWLSKEAGVAAIPLSVFCADPFPHKLDSSLLCKQGIDAAGSGRAPERVVIILPSSLLNNDGLQTVQADR